MRSATWKRSAVAGVAIVAVAMASGAPTQAAGPVKRALFAKKADRAKKAGYANNAGRLQGKTISTDGSPNTIPVLDAQGRLPASVAARGAQGPAGPQGPVGPQGPKGDTGSVDTSRFYNRDESDARFVRGGGQILSNREVLFPGVDDQVLLDIPGVGQVLGSCSDDAMQMIFTFKNTSGHTEDVIVTEGSAPNLAPGGTVSISEYGAVRFAEAQVGHLDEVTTITASNRDCYAMAQAVTTE